jgi:TolA-binding protein
MKTTSKAMILSVMAIALTSCTMTHTSAPTIPANASTSFDRTSVFCPTDDEQAKKSYNDAIALQGEGKLDEAEQLFLKAIQLYFPLSWT